jgi:hypothetical protein
MFGNSKNESQNDDQKIVIEELDKAFFEIIEKHSAGNPCNEHDRWTNLTRKEISKLLHEKNFYIGTGVVKQLLKKHGFGYRKMRKNQTMKQAKNRDDQFINMRGIINEFGLSPANPIISIDNKKKEMFGNFYRDGKVYTKDEIYVYDHDFNNFSEGSIIPFGIFDVKQNIGYMYIGTSAETSEFICDNIKKWWLNYGIKEYPNATSILIQCDGGGGNSSRSLLFKRDLEILANELNIEIRICHFPPYTSKYNPIEHRLFPHVHRSMQGVILKNMDIVKKLINRTTTSKGLKVIVEVVDKVYKKGRKVAKDYKKNMSILFDDYLPRWNYRAVPCAPN